MTTTVSRPDAALATSKFGARRVSVVDNGVDPDYFHPNGGYRDPRWWQPDDWTWLTHERLGRRCRRRDSLQRCRRISWLGALFTSGERWHQHFRFARQRR